MELLAPIHTQGHTYMPAILSICRSGTRLWPGGGTCWRAPSSASSLVRQQAQRARFEHRWWHQRPPCRGWLSGAFVQTQAAEACSQQSIPLASLQAGCASPTVFCCSRQVCIPASCTESQTQSCVPGTLGNTDSFTEFGVAKRMLFFCLVGTASGAAGVLRFGT